MEWIKQIEKYNPVNEQEKKDKEINFESRKREDLNNMEQDKIKKKI